MTDDSDELTAVYMLGLHDGRKSSQRTWVGLTREDIQAAFDTMTKWGDYAVFAQAIEAKLKEKNT